MIDPAAIAHDLQSAGFARSPATDVTPWLAVHNMQDWAGFAASWNDLGIDQYMADHGRYRQRRHAVFLRDAAGLTRQPHRAHYQTLDYNALNGGIERWFEPVQDNIARHPALLAALELAYQSFHQAAAHPLWEIELHQFRITTAANQSGRPTPEGMHRDGVDFVMVMLVRRENVQSGVTIIEDFQQNPLGSFTLSHPMDATFVDDHRVFHGVTPIVPINPDQPAWRDVLVATFRRK